MIDLANPYGGFSESYAQDLINAAGMDVVIEFTSPVVAPSPLIDQRTYADQDHFEICGECCIAMASTATGGNVTVKNVLDDLRAHNGEAGVQHGTDMWELSACLDRLGVPHVCRQAKCGDAAADMLARDRVGLIALWCAYGSGAEARNLHPQPGGTIGHWELAGAVHGSGDEMTPDLASALVALAEAIAGNRPYSFDQPGSVDSKGFANQRDAIATLGAEAVVNNILHAYEPRWVGGRTAGPQGPPGPKGDKGDKGDPGEDRIVRTQGGPQ